MKKKIFIGLNILFTAFLFFIVQTSVSAAGVGLGVQPVLPENQRDTSASYFDFIAAPNVATTLTINLSNDSDSKIVVAATVVPAQTSTSGAVSYPDTTVKFANSNEDLSKFVDKVKQSITIPAQSTVAYTVKLIMPAEELSGVVAGGIIFKPENQGSTSNSGLTVKSEYQYAIAIVARNYDKTWEPELKIEDAEIEQVEYSNLLNVVMENVSSTFLNQLRIEETITRKGSAESYKKVSTDMQMAPNTSFKYGVNLPDKVKSGTYAINLTAYYVKDDNGKYTASDGQKYQYSLDFSKDVKLSAKTAKTFSNKIAEVTTKKTDMIKYSVVGGIGLLIVLVIFLIIFYRRKKRENQELKKELEKARQEIK